MFDHCFWFGDLNYRVDRGDHGSEAEFADTLARVEADDVATLLDSDQLTAERVRSRAGKG